MHRRMERLEADTQLPNVGVLRAILSLKQKIIGKEL